MRPCAAPACPVLVERGRCAIHTKALDRARGTAQQRGYDYPWSQYSRLFLSQHPVCGERANGQVYAEHSQCAQAGRTGIAQCTDHIIPMTRGGSKWDATNHQALCLACNSAKGNR